MVSFGGVETWSLYRAWCVQCNCREPDQNLGSISRSIAPFKWIPRRGTCKEIGRTLSQTDAPRLCVWPQGTQYDGLGLIVMRPGMLNMLNALSSRISMCVSLTEIDTACSSSLSALHAALRSLEVGAVFQEGCATQGRWSRHCTGHRKTLHSLN